MPPVFRFPKSLAGMTFVPVSPAYALMSQDFQKLRSVHDKIRPVVVYAETRAPFERARR